MREIPAGFAVRLIRDYTRYHRDLKVGAKGIAESLPVGRAALSKNQFVTVKFVVDAQVFEKTKKKLTTYEESVTLDVLRSDIEVTDPRWVEWQERETKAREDALAKHVKTATVVTTPRGGFIELRVEYDHGRPNDIWKRKSDCKDILADLEKRGVLEELVKGTEG